MILPKGTLEFQRNGGDDAINDIMDRIKEQGLTGYILILGKVENKKGEMDDLTGQLVFKEGMPVLCESVIINKSHKGENGIHPLLKSMLLAESDIEFKSKIDVEPPIAFFKECKVDESSLDIDHFMKMLKKEEEEKRKKEEENKRREEKKSEIKDMIEDWISNGYDIPSYPSIMDSKFEELEEWYDELSKNVSTINDHLKWLREVDEVEVEDSVEALAGMMKKPEMMEEIEKAKREFEEVLQGIQEKRGEINKWVNLWKDEGYNTIQIEENLKHDLNTAWNAMTQFMDDIQQLKDAKEEVENIKVMDGARGFDPEIRDIDFLLNDPAELENIRLMTENLKSAIEEEKIGKAEMLRMAEEIEKKGFDISIIRGAMYERLKPLKEKFNLLMNNTIRITEIREELASMDRLDIPQEIDSFVERTKDPMKLDDYESTLLEMKDRISIFKDQRDAVITDMEKIKDDGFLVDLLEEKISSPIEQLMSFKEEFNGMISELKGLKDKVLAMDNRWLSEDFQSLERGLIDPDRIAWIKQKIGEVQEKIDKRETLRQKVKDDIETWQIEGFIVEGLKDVVEGDLSEFSPVHDHFTDNIDQAKELLSKLNSLESRFFTKRAEEVKMILRNPDELENGKTSLEELEKLVADDRKLRANLANRMKTLKEEGWSIEGLEGLLEVEPQELKPSMEKLELNVYKLQEMEADIDSWDPLETNWLSTVIEELRVHLKRIADYDAAADHFNTLKEKISSNRERRQQIKKQIDDWKEAGYITKKASLLTDKDLDSLASAFDDLSEKITILENLQGAFDDLDTKHFSQEAEDIEFKLNDIDLIDEITTSIEELGAKIEQDKQKRSEYLVLIDDYIAKGFKGAEKLNEVMEEDISIVDLEFKNFHKEVELFQKYMEKVGYISQPVSSDEDKKKVE